MINLEIVFLLYDSYNVKTAFFLYIEPSDIVISKVDQNSLFFFSNSRNRVHNKIL